jgi:hypothetical protein
MAHDWQNVSSRLDIPETLFRHVRICRLCGKGQVRESDMLWGRITGYRWVPFVGRCPGKHKPNCLGKKLTT